MKFIFALYKLLKIVIALRGNESLEDKTPLLGCKKSEWRTFICDLIVAHT